MLPTTDPEPQHLPPTRRRRLLLTAIVWAIFLAGVSIHLFVPRLKVENGAFVIPQQLASASNGVHPADLVYREKRIRLLSAILTLGGAAGLGIIYGAFFGRRSSAC